MIKINLLPAYILEARRVKVVIALMALLVIAVAGALAAYVWAPAPFSLTSQHKAAQDELQQVTAQATPQASRPTTRKYPRLGLFSGSSTSLLMSL